MDTKASAGIESDVPPEYYPEVMAERDTGGNLDVLKSTRRMQDPAGVEARYRRESNAPNLRRRKATVIYRVEASLRWRDSRPFRFLILSGSNRRQYNCPGVDLKSRMLMLRMAERLRQDWEIDFEDLGNVYGRARTQSCNACVSTSMALCCWPCNCYEPNNKDEPDLMWDLDMYARLDLADSWGIVGPINWYAPSSNLKLLFDRLVCMNGGNPREDLIDHKNAEIAVHSGVGLPYADNQAEDMVREPEVIREFDAWVERFAAHVAAKGKIEPGRYWAYRYQAPSHRWADVKLKWREWAMGIGHPPGDSSPANQQELDLTETRQCVRVRAKARSCATRRLPSSTSQRPSEHSIPGPA